MYQSISNCDAPGLLSEILRWHTRVPQPKAVTHNILVTIAYNIKRFGLGESRINGFVDAAAVSAAPGLKPIMAHGVALKVAAGALWQWRHDVCDDSGECQRQT